jgi:uncharacterized membrane protein YkoI
MATEKIFLPVLILIFFVSAKEVKSSSFIYLHSVYSNSDTNSSNIVNIVEAIGFTTQLLDGDIVKAERKFKRDIPIWKIDMITKEKGSFEVEISAVDKSLIRIDADEGPFEYEIRPDESLISFSEAKNIAEQMTGQKTLKWNLYKNRNTWEYNFWIFIKSGKAQVRVDAASGDIITSKKRK